MFPPELFFARNRIYENEGSIRWKLLHIFLEIKKKRYVKIADSSPIFKGSELDYEFDLSDFKIEYFIKNNAIILQKYRKKVLETYEDISVTKSNYALKKKGEAFKQYMRTTSFFVPLPKKI